MILGRLNEDLKSALKSGEIQKATVLRFLLAQIRNREIEKRGRSGSSELAEEEIIEVLQKEVKRRKEAIELFKKGKREDLISKEEVELKIISQYLPPPISKEEAEAIIQNIISKGLTNFNEIMKEATKLLRGRIEGKVLAEIVKEKLEKSSNQN